MNNVGLISTSATIANNVYEDKLKESGIDFIAPDNLQRAQMDKIIQRLVEGQHLNSDRDLILKVVDDLVSKGVDGVALACTDLQLLLPSSDKVHIFDTMDVLAQATVKTILS
jgi:aspartate racemase